MTEKERPFYDVEVIREREAEYIRDKLKKYRNDPVTEGLKEKIWEELQMEKHLGKITIPFKVVMRSGPSKKFPDYIEVILDSKV